MTYVQILKPINTENGEEKLEEGEITAEKMMFMVYYYEDYKKKFNKNFSPIDFNLDTLNILLNSESLIAE